MINTSTSAVQTSRFDLSQLGYIMMSRGQPAYGFFLSRVLWVAMEARLLQETGGEAGLGRAPTSLQGVRIALDASLPDTEFDVAFTEQAWLDRLAQLSDTSLPET